MERHHMLSDYSLVLHTDKVYDEEKLFERIVTIYPDRSGHVPEFSTRYYSLLKINQRFIVCQGCWNPIQDLDYYEDDNGELFVYCVRCVYVCDGCETHNFQHEGLTHNE